MTMTAIEKINLTNRLREELVRYDETISKMLLDDIPLHHIKEAEERRKLVAQQITRMKASR